MRSDKLPLCKLEHGLSTTGGVRSVIGCVICHKEYGYERYLTFSGVVISHGFWPFLRYCEMAYGDRRPGNFVSTSSPQRRVAFLGGFWTFVWKSSCKKRHISE